MKAGEIAFLWKRMQERAIYVATIYQKTVNEMFCTEEGEKICGAEVGRRCDFDKLDEITEYYFTCSYEYNSACHCHPEYTKYAIVVPVALLEYNYEEQFDSQNNTKDWEPDFDANYKDEEIKQIIITVLTEEKAKRDENRKQADEIKKKREEKEANLKKMQQEEKDRRTYEELKKKFG